MGHWRQGLKLVVRPLHFDGQVFDRSMPSEEVEEKSCILDLSIRLFRDYN
jgi:hypothetical protein